LAALAYGSSWVIPRFALGDTGPTAGILGGLISYVAAIAVGAFVLLFPNVRQNVFSMTRESARWLIGSGVFVAAAQGLFFAAVTVAPIMLVIPLIQLSLAFRILFSTWLSPMHEVVGALVLAGVVTSITGALMVSIDSALIVRALALPEGVAPFLLWSV
jgi:uncharacterized membrane protein